MSPTKSGVEEQPEWLNESFFRDIYEQREEFRGTEFSLEILEAGSVVSAGENFCASMYRVKVKSVSAADGQEEVRSFIVKAAKNHDFLKEQNVFGTEFEMYRNVLGAFEDMWTRIGEPVTFGPKCLKIVQGETDILVLSDLKEDGFGMLDRLEGMNEDATLLVLSLIAKFHASSVAYREQVGEFGPLVMRKIIRPSTADRLMDYCTPKVKVLAEAALEWNLGERIADAISSWASQMFDGTMAVTDPDTAPEDFQVLCHGDLWLNNMMFTRHEETEHIKDAVLIDFQLSYWNRPEGDLFYFLISSVATQVLVERFDSFVQFYHQELSESLRKLKVRQRSPSLKGLHMQLLRNSFHICRTMVGVLPVILMDKSEGLRIEDLLNEAGPEKAAAMERKMFHNSRMQEKMKRLLPFFHNRGMLDMEEQQEHQKTGGGGKRVNSNGNGI